MKTIFKAIVVGIISVVVIGIVAEVILKLNFNYGLVDLEYSFNYCQISMPDGSVIEGEVEKWWDYEDDDQMQVMVDGNVYLTHSSNIVLVKKEIDDVR